MINKTLDIDITKGNECNFSFIKGDTFRLVVNVKNNGEVFILTGYTPILTAMRIETETTADIQLYGSDIDTSKANEGQLKFTFNPSDTESLTAGNYKYDIQITSSENTYTIIKSNLEIIQDITKGTDVVAKYKVYIASLIQTGTNAPTAIVLENTLGGTVVWTRASAGNYIATLAGAFTPNKTISPQDYVVCNNGSTEFNMVAGRATDDTFAVITGADNVLSYKLLEIRVYN